MSSASICLKLKLLYDNIELREFKTIPETRVINDIMVSMTFFLTYPNFGSRVVSGLVADGIKHKQDQKCEIKCNGCSPTRKFSTIGNIQPGREENSFRCTVQNNFQCQKYKVFTVKGFTFGSISDIGGKVRYIEEYVL